MASSSIVIKVTFGETLRRFNARILEEGLDLDMPRLRGKILSLFGFAPDVDLILTYIDEDGDVVTLADEDDLRDIVRQSLNPLRITVRLNKDKLGKSDVKSSGSSTPQNPAQDQLSFQTLNSGVPQILVSAFSELGFDLASKATSSSPVLTELIEKMKMTYLNHLPGSQPSETPEITDIKEQPGSKIVEKSEKLSDTNSGTSNVKENKVPVDGEVGILKSKNNVDPPKPVDLNVPYFDYANQSHFKLKGVEGSGNRSYSHVVSDDGLSLETNKDDTVGLEKKEDSGADSSGFGSSNPNYLKHCLETSKSDDSGGSSLWQQGMWSATNECPFGGIPLSNDSNVQGNSSAPRVLPFKRSYNHANGMGSIFHRGVRCDGCGVHPITGPRFKSKVKHDYDLCYVCFAGMGNDTDYIRLDRPAIHRHSLPFKGLFDPSLRFPPPPPVLSHVLRGHGMKPSRAKLDSRFILDVNVLDGTVMAPSTTFTKIWRMRNNGSIIWPWGSHLLWIGGDRLSNTVSAEVQVPAGGLPVDEELDIAVDFTAPQLPGRYISYWRLASPSGKKFGQRVWVLIQVDASMKDLGETSINLNLPPVSSGMKDPEAAHIKVDQDPLMGGVLPENNFIRLTESENPFLDAHPNKDQESNFPINDTLIIGNGGSSSTTATLGASSSPFEPPVIYVDFSGMADLVQPPNAVVQPSGSAVEEPSVGNLNQVAQPANAVMQPSGYVVQEPSDENPNLDREQTLLRELEEMGFKPNELNKEILRMNEYNLERCVDYLCGVSEWDPILEELQEMGFSDNETNKRLLKKNNGSIKRVVMDLINGETA